MTDENARPVSPPNRTASNSPNERVSSNSASTTATPETAIIAFVACHRKTPPTMSDGDRGVAAAAWNPLCHLNPPSTGHIASDDVTIIAVVTIRPGPRNWK